MITENAHLIDGTGMPDAFSKMLAHVATYKAVMETWSDHPPIGELSYDEARAKNTALIPFFETIVRSCTQDIQLI